MATQTPSSLVLSVDELKSLLPITYVLHHYGHSPAKQSGNRLHYISPFRDDTNPSLDVFYSEDGIQRWGDFAEGTQGSVIDIVQRFEGDCSFAKALPIVREIYNEFLDAVDWTEELSPADRLAEVEPDVLEFEQDLPLVTSNGSRVVNALMAGRPGISVRSLQAFGVRDGGHYLAAIYPDQRAIRIRDEKDKWFRAGSKVSLYHAPGQGPEDLPDLPVLLVEGESDAWAAYGTFHREMVVCALPGTGNVREKFVSAFFGRQVVLGFDGDSAGRQFSRHWAAKLKDAGCSVSILPLPEGRDLASFPPESLSELMNRRRQATVNVTNLRAARDGYVLVSSDGTREDLVSNWWAEVVEVLLGEEDHSYVCRVHSSEGPFDGRYLLKSRDLESGPAMARWCRKFHGSWWGTTTDAQKLVAELEEQSVYVPMTRTVDRPMLVRPGGFVLPDLQVATDMKLNEDSLFAVLGEEMEWPDRGDASIETLDRLLAMHTQKVMAPILAWLAIAPIRSRYKQFPPLFVTGAAGTGKTTLLDHALRVFANISTCSALTNTTPYAVAMRIGSTNCLPVWFDEYRPGGRRSSIEALDQMIRDSYTGTVSYRGGMADDKSQVTALRTDAPLVISGEDLADEQSHRDRLVRVVIPLKGKGPLPGRHKVDRYWAQEYLWWLASRGRDFSASIAARPPEIDDERYIRRGLNERQAWNLGILDAGWGLLSDFADEISNGSYELPDPDWSGVLEMAAGDTGDRILEFLQDMHEDWGPTNAMYYDDIDEVTRISPMLVVKRATDERIPLPFRSSRSLLSHLELNLEGTKLTSARRGMVGKKRIRYVEIEGNILEGE